MIYYPIGIVVILQEGKWPLMIYGRKAKPNRKTEQPLYDYLGCLYPQGDLGKKHRFYFQHEDIDRVLHEGMLSEMETEMEQILHLEELSA